MLNHSVSISVREAELGFAIHKLPSKEDATRWNGKFERICAKRIDDSSYVMKFEANPGSEYYHFKWGVPKNLDRLSPRWIPAGHAFTDPEMAIQSASVDLSDPLSIIESRLPDSDNSP